VNVKLLIILFYLIFIAPTYAGIELIFPVSKVKQGSLQEVKLILDEQTAQRVELQKLKGQSLGELIYLHSVSPLLRRKGRFEADATIVFAKIPSTNEMIYKNSNGDVKISWNFIEVEPTEVPKDLLFLDFDIPKPARVLLWVLVIFVSGFIGYLILRARRKWIAKREMKLKRQRIREDLYRVSKYNMVVSTWQNKHHLVKEFPHLAEPFSTLELTLFKYQFKQTQTDDEKEEVLKAWHAFLESSKEGFNGI
jgi:hypothetical protein